MSFEEEFDENIRQKVEDGKYPFDESNWIRASRMLDVERKTERLALLKKFYIPSALVLLLGLSSGVLVYKYVNSGSQASEKIVAVKTATAIPATATEARATDEGAATAIPANDARATVIPATARDGATEEAIKIRATEKPIIAEATANKTELIQQVNTESAPPKVVQSEPASENAVQFKTEKSIAAADLKTNNTKEISSQLFGSRANENTPGGGAKEPGTNNITANRSSSNPPAINNVGDDNALNNRVTTPEIAAQQQDQQKQSERQEIESSEYLASVSASIPYEMADPDLYPSFGHYKKPRDDDYYSKHKKAKIHYLNAEAGAAYMLGWQGGSGQDAKGFDWFGGINYGFYLSKKISIGLGLQAYNIGNINNAFFDNSRKNYSFGSTESYTIITTHNLYYAAVPFRISYDLNANNRFGVGVNGAWLVTAKNTVETYDEQDNAKVNDVKTNNTGVYQGVKDKNVMLSVFYRSQVTSRVAVNAEFTYGMTDIFDNNSKYTTAQKPMGFRVGLQYTLFDK